MTSNGVGSANGVRSGGSEANQATTTSAQVSNIRNVRSRAKPAPSPASIGAVATVKTLANDFDPTDLPSATYERMAPAHAAGAQIAWTRPPDASDALTSTWRTLENVVGSLSDHANKPALADLDDEFADRPDMSDRDLLEMARDQRLAEDVLQSLQQAGLDDDSREAVNARALMTTINARWRQRLPGGGAAANASGRARIERDYEKQKADAVAFIRSARPKLPPADRAFRQLEDLYADVSNDRRLEPMFDARSRARLGCDLQTLHELIQAGKRNGWLPGNGQASTDPASQRFMEAKICRLADAIAADIHGQLGRRDGRENGQDLIRAGRQRDALAADTREYLSALARFERAPKTASFAVPRQVIADALIEAHDTRGREIMDSLPPGYLADRVAGGESAQTLADRLKNCSDLLHVSRTGIRRGFWRGLRNLGSRELTSWQAAQVRRTVAMLALGDAPKPVIKAVREKLIDEMRAANQQIGTRNRQNVEAAVSLLSWDARPFESLSTYTGRLEQTVAGRSAAEQRRWLPLTNLHTAMNNVSMVLQAGGSASDALTVLNYDLRFARTARLAGDGANAPRALLPSIGEPPRSLVRLALLEDDSIAPVTAHPHADLLTKSERGAPDLVNDADEPSLQASLANIQEEYFEVPQPDAQDDDEPRQDPEQAMQRPEIELQMSRKPAFKKAVDDD